MVTRHLKPLKDQYSDEDELTDEFCRRNGCSECNGSDHNGEPNGYGCDFMEKFVDDNYHLIIDDE